MRDELGEPLPAISNRGDHSYLGQNRDAENSALSDGSSYDLFLPLRIGTDNATYSQSFQGKVLGKTIDRDRAASDLGRERSQAGGLMGWVDNVCPDFIRENP